VDHGGGIPPSALMFLGFIVVVVGLAIALKMPPTKNNNKK
jgi:hypothetical protein